MYWIVLGFDIVVYFTVVFFFLVGFADGSVTPDNVRPWIAALAVLTLIVVATLTCKVKGRHRAAMALGLVLGVPGLVVLLLVVGGFLAQPDFH